MKKWRALSLAALCAVTATVIGGTVVNADEYDMPADRHDSTYRDAYHDHRVCFVVIADRGTVAIVDRWTPVRYEDPDQALRMGTTVGATLCEPWDYEYGSSGWHREPWMPAHVEDRDEYHDVIGDVFEWGASWPWLSATLWFTPQATS